MAGHSHWKQIKQQKGAADQKRGQLFSKLVRAVTLAAKENQNPQLNSRLRNAIEKAREANVPQENIERALQRAKSDDTQLEEITVEAYGPGGIALLIQAITNNKNRTIAEIKIILKDHEAKFAEPGSVRWAFALSPEKEWEAKFTQVADPPTAAKLATLVGALEAHNEVTNVVTNLAP